jgi:preprotein translocase subunit SecE
LNGSEEIKGSSIQMAKTAAITAPNENGVVAQVKSWPQRIKAFYNDVRVEMKKVTTPSRKQVQSTTVVVIVTVFIFGAYFYLVDSILGHSLDTILRRLINR